MAVVGIVPSIEAIAIPAAPRFTAAQIATKKQRSEAIRELLASLGIAPVRVKGECPSTATRTIVQFAGCACNTSETGSAGCACADCNRNRSAQRKLAAIIVAAYPSIAPHHLAISTKAGHWQPKPRSQMMRSTFGTRNGLPGFDEFKTGLTFQDGLNMLWVDSDNPDDWKRKSPGMVLRILHKIKLEMYEQAIARAEEQNAAALDSHRDTYPPDWDDVVPDGSDLGTNGDD